jgi:hypothetical protein
VVLEVQQRKKRIKLTCRGRRRNPRAEIIPQWTVRSARSPWYRTCLRNKLAKSLTVTVMVVIEKT